MTSTKVGLDWDRDGRAWPNREASRFVEAGGLRWHVQVAGEGPALLLLHGTGASTHSWRGILPLLAKRWTVIAPDLPGHGFTGHLPAHRLTLPGMAKAVAALTEALALPPAAIVGHSAGAAIAIRIAIDGLASPRAIVSLNGALVPFDSFVGPIFESTARLMVTSPLVSRLFAWRAESPRFIRRLLNGTGSRIDAEGARLYARLASNPSHVAGALGMMAGWDLRGLERELPRLDLPLFLIVGGEDAMVPAKRAFDVKARVAGSKVIYLRGLGHLAHEEAPDTVAEVIESCIAEATVQQAPFPEAMSHA